MNRLRLAASVLALAWAAGPASALSTQECSTKYQAAKEAGTLNGMKWNDFRKAQCGADAQSAAATTPAPAQTEAAKPAPESPVPAASGPTVFPKAVDPKYASESAGKGRRKTCLDQYNANKANGGNGGNGALKWIVKGGGYYSECTKRLKG